MTLLSCTAMEGAAAGSADNVETSSSQLEVLLPLGTSGGGMAAGAGPLPGPRGGVLARLRAEKALVMVRPAALAALRGANPVLPKGIRTRVDKAASTSVQNRQFRDFMCTSQTQQDVFPLLVGYDVKLVAGADDVLEFITFWECPVGYSVPLRRLLAPRQNKCDVLRRAIQQLVPGLCPPLTLDESTVRSRAQCHKAGGGSVPLRTVEQLEVVMPDGRIATRACKGVEVAMEAQDQEALEAGVVSVPACFHPALREVDGWVAVTKQLCQLRGEEALARCFPEMFGWDVLEPTPGTFKFVAYFEWMEHGSAWDYLRGIMTSASVSNGELFDKVLDTIGQAEK
ncbi:hypothetical protein HXX76_002395 [Chlamydomonas incerta]|uniref:Uncharacterized protein n=1 Tax=Chlamydomonas incerta TaxID=51695 RepID=A0A835TKP7_CHLIN|nr:hypothetical protein HXX76_002395 [Chlamydomonas incerta]|eukprot:KAG2442309.1 hypothetical protein HXX76_002395 [Chlamydomonas incerta]